MNVVESIVGKTIVSVQLVDQAEESGYRGDFAHEGYVVAFSDGSRVLFGSQGDGPNGVEISSPDWITA